MPTITISCEGDRTFRDTLNILARRRGVKIAQLVKQALEREYGPELAEVRSLFFANSETQMSQVEHERDTSNER